MSFSLKPRTPMGRTADLRRRRRLEAGRERARERFTLKRMRAWIFPVSLFCFMTAAIVFICFCGRTKTGPYLTLNQVASLHISAQKSFSYPSAIQTKRQKQQSELLVPTVIRVDTLGLESFQKRIDLFLKTFEERLGGISKDTPAETREETANALSLALQKEDNLAVPAATLLLLADETSAKDRQRLFTGGMRALADILRGGVYAPSKFGLDEAEGQNLLFATQPGEHDAMLDARTMSEARRQLEKDMPYASKSAVNAAVLQILEQGLETNVVPDTEATRKRKAQAAARVPEVTVSVEKGQPIIEEGRVVTEEDLEKLNAYQRFLRTQEENAGVFNPFLVQYTMLTVVLLMCAALYLKIAMPTTTAPRPKVLLMALVLLITLGLARGFIALDHTTFFLTRPYIQGAFSVLVPPVFGALLVSVLIGTRPAVLVCLLASIFSALMIGNSLEVFVGSFLASLITIRMTKGIHQRGRIVRASFFAGLTLAVLSLVFGLYYNFALIPLLIKMITGIAVCVTAGILALGFFPLFEFIFKITTDIRLLELTDFNHPLLRRLQIDAPGTYHHSLMVANLAERAAADVGANPIACRVGALFHDIGKIDRPEYFTENQRNGINPHNGDVSAPMSALIIKSHVKEGMDIALHAKLPQIVRDAIGQHHGTGLIRYFFEKANRAHKAEEQGPQKLTPLDMVDEATYRYDGPKPQTRETAIIQLADSVEAASRSLKKVTPQSVEELIDSITREKLLDGQLDECPITVQELSKIKASFALTLLTMLHGRVSYSAPAAAPAAKPA